MANQGKIEIEYLNAEGESVHRDEITAPRYDGTVWIKVDYSKLQQDDVMMVRARLVTPHGIDEPNLRLELLPVEVDKPAKPRSGKARFA